MTAVNLSWCPPPGDDVMVLAAGRQWDAVRVSTAVAEWAFQFLDGAEDCAAIVDPRAAWVYWLLPPHLMAAAPVEQWDRLDGYVTRLTAGPAVHYLAVPPNQRRSGPGLHWRIPRHWSGRYLARPSYLSTVLATAIAFTHGLDALPQKCPICDRSLTPDEAVSVMGRRYPTDALTRPLSVHSNCARQARLTAQEPRR
ncbi:hypothetical protein [Streptomyces zagrosensis]|uniref:Uncharacterized protein n=1 Tax=Streptomyces zagrosensis TaxID=1042984 RepID=A0A7W9UYY7_9ACTN|nr:hypothetical protein [Streptomyces zagrosensis]MBB5935851.1 hypothetical protein [Streptomyces zagrosensis]